MDAYHIFPQSMLVILPLIGGVIDVARFIAYTECWVDLPLCSVTVIALSGVGSNPQLLE